MNISVDVHKFGRKCRFCMEPIPPGERHVSFCPDNGRDHKRYHTRCFLVIIGDWLKIVKSEGSNAMVRICRVCGCTDDRACMTTAGPCYWVEDDLCSACAEKVPRKVE